MTDDSVTRALAVADAGYARAVGAVRTQQAAKVAAKAIHEQWYHEGDECLHPDGCEDDTATRDGWAVAIALADIGLLAIPRDTT